MLHSVVREANRQEEDVLAEIMSIVRESPEGASPSKIMYDVGLSWTKTMRCLSFLSRERKLITLNKTTGNKRKAVATEEGKGIELVPDSFHDCGWLIGQRTAWQIRRDIAKAAYTTGVVSGGQIMRQVGLNWAQGNRHISDMIKEEYLKTSGDDKRTYELTPKGVKEFINGREIGHVQKSSQDVFADMFRAARYGMPDGALPCVAQRAGTYLEFLRDTGLLTESDGNLAATPLYDGADKQALTYVLDVMSEEETPLTREIDVLLEISNPVPAAKIYGMLDVGDRDAYERALLSLVGRGLATSLMHGNHRLYQATPEGEKLVSGIKSILNGMSAAQNAHASYPIASGSR